MALPEIISAIFPVAPRRAPRGVSGILLLGVAALIAAAALVMLALSFDSSAQAQSAHPRPAPPLAWQSIGSQGTAPGQFQQPRGITGLADGSFVVVDRAARVQHFSAAGKPLGEWCMKDHALGNPKGLCAMPDGNLLICDTHYGRVLEMTLDGQIVKQWGGFGKGPGQFTHPLSCCVNGKRGRAYVVEYHNLNDRVQIFKLDGTFIKAFGSFGSKPGQFNRPSGITLDRDGNVYVADACNHRVEKFDYDGKLLLMFGKMGMGEGELRYPYDIACGEETIGGERRQVLYVAEFNNMRVSVFELDGTFVRTIGQAGTGKEEFASPWSLTVDARGRLLVSDTGNYRVQIFDFSASQSKVAVAPAAAVSSGSKQRQ